MILKRGDKGKDVEILQHLLNNRGYDAGADDGVFGAQTESAVKQFQKNNYIDADGVVGPATNEVLSKDPSGFTNYLLKKGSKGESVRILQRKLIEVGYSVGSSGADGIFGQGTEDAVRRFQGSIGLDADGVAGDNTWEALRRAEIRGGSTSSGLLRKGDRGESVRKLQQALINAGYSVGSYGADGVFGQGTEDAVRRLQEKNHIGADGIAGPATWSVLRGGSTSSRLLRKGDRGESVRELQQALINAGYSVGSYGADGVFGQGTEDAVRRLQEKNHIGADGIAGPATWSALRGGSTSSGLLRKGDRGESVRELQQALINAGYSVGSYGADGVFGQGTEDAVRRLQEKNHIGADGIAGPATWNVLGYNSSENNNIDYLDGDGISKFLEIARSQLGYHEGSNNNNKYGIWYGDNNQPWCAMFVSWCANKAGIMGKIIPHYEGCFYGVQWYRDKRRFKLSGIYTPKPGDVFFMSGYSHTGIVESVKGNIVVTLEGNDSNDSVGRHYRSIESIWGFGTNGGAISSIPSNSAIYKQQADIGFAPLLGISEVDVSKSITRTINTGALNISLEYSLKIEKAFENKNDKGVLSRKLSIEDLKEGNIVFSDDINEVTIDFIKKSVSSIGFLLNKFGNNEVKIIFNAYPTASHLDISLEFTTKYAGDVSAIQSLRIITTKVPNFDDGRVEVSKLVENVPKYIVCVIIIVLVGVATKGTEVPAALRFLGGIA